jgi:hypothetical protein
VISHGMHQSRGDLRGVRVILQCLAMMHDGEITKMIGMRMV